MKPHLLLILLVGCLATACTPDEALTPRISTVSPAAVTQDAVLTLYGEHFGALEPGQSQVFVNGVCSEIGAWESDRIQLRVPTGIGTGLKTLVVRTASGATARASVTLSGAHRPAPAERACERGLVRSEPRDAVSLPDTALPDTSTPLPDTAVPPDTAPKPDTTPPPEDVGGSGLRYIILRDLSNNELGRNPGVDIDAVILRKQTGTDYNATRVVDYEIGPLSPEQNDPASALGPPDAWLNFPDLGWCYVRQGTVALGGAGYLVLELPIDADPGDVLEIYEVGACNYAPGMQAISEPYSVALARSPDSDERIPLGEGAGPLSMFEIPEF